MNLPTKRGYARTYMDVPIKFVLGASDEQYSGLMKNCSVGGMCFVTNMPLKPGAPIDIRIVDSGVAHTVPVDLNFEQSSVAWCEPMDKKCLRFGVGVTFRRPVKRKKRRSSKAGASRETGQAKKAVPSSS